MVETATIEQQKQMGKQQEEVKESNTLKRLVKVFSVIGFIIVVITLILIKRSKPDFPLGTIILISVVSLIFFGLIYFAFTLKDRLFGGKDKEELSKKGEKTITIVQAYEIAEEALKSKKYADYIEKVIDEGVEEHGAGVSKSKIYFLYVTGKYTQNKYFIAINMHCPDENRRIIVNPTSHQIHRAKQYLASTPEDEPDTEVVEMKNPLTGIEERVVRTTRTKRQREEEAKKADLE